MELTKGTRIYYGGDMANDDGTGTIIEAYVDKWGSFVDITMDDGRKINGLSIVSFSPEYLGHGGTRFVTLEAYNAFRRTQFERMGFMEYKDAR